VFLFLGLAFFCASMSETSAFALSSHESWFSMSSMDFVNGGDCPFSAVFIGRVPSFFLAPHLSSLAVFDPLKRRTLGGSITWLTSPLFFDHFPFSIPDPPSTSVFFESFDCPRQRGSFRPCPLSSNQRGSGSCFCRPVSNLFTCQGAFIPVGWRWNSRFPA